VNGLQGIAHWVEDRTGLGGLLARLLGGQVERRGAWLRTTGMACLVLLLVEGVTGAVLGLFYTPSPTAAYQSIQALDANIMGRFLRGIHHWGSAALILLSGFTLARMFFGGEYRQRRDVVWIGVLLFAQFALFFQLTGHILPWDTNAVATAQVEAGIGGNTWVVGPFLKRFLLAGSDVSGATLSRWYGFHTFVFPVLVLLILALPLFAYRLRQGAHRDETESAADNGRKRIFDPYYPVHMAREMTVSLVVFLAVAGLAWFSTTPLEKEATAANLSGYQALSEWYVLPLHGLTLLPPFTNEGLEPIATVVLPGLLVTVLLLLPFLDRSPTAAPRKRPAALAAGSLVLLSTVALALFSLAKDKETAKAQPVPPSAKGQVAREDAPKTDNLVFDAALIERGKKVYADNSCGGCHAINEQGGKIGPPLTKAGLAHPEREWQMAHLQDPKSKVPDSTMPAYKQLKPEDLKALAEYMVSLR
jgi:ubiquinol-cytochrome c reductase cytochrome b subunit